MNKPEPMTPEQISPHVKKWMQYYGYKPEHSSLTSGAGFFGFSQDLLAARDKQWEEMLAKQEPVGGFIYSGNTWDQVAKEHEKDHDVTLLYAAQVDQQAEIERLKEQNYKLATAVGDQNRKFIAAQAEIERIRAWNLRLGEDLDILLTERIGLTAEIERLKAQLDNATKWLNATGTSVARDEAQEEIDRLREALGKK